MIDCASIRNSNTKLNDSHSNNSVEQNSLSSNAEKDFPRSEFKFMQDFESEKRARVKTKRKANYIR